MAFSAGASVRMPEMTMGSFSAAGVWASSFSMSASTSSVCSSLVMKKALLKMSLRWAAVISGCLASTSSTFRMAALWRG